jgi:hypothetical protein
VKKGNTGLLIPKWEYVKHLRRFGKKLFWGAERIAEKKDNGNRLVDSCKEKTQGATE